MKVATTREVAEARAIGAKRCRVCFGDGRLYVERYLGQPVTLKFKSQGDHHGNVVHFGERDCSLQRRHQKVLEEAPSPALNATGEINSATVTSALKDLGYHSAGTVEFLL